MMMPSGRCLTRRSFQVSRMMLVSLVFALPFAAAAQVDRIDGYDGFAFGMTIEQATAIRPGSKVEPCGFAGVVGCIEFKTNVSAFPATVDVQFSGDPPVVTQIVLIVESLADSANSPCTAVTNELGRLLAAKYGNKFLIVRNTATWASAHGGAVSLTALCVNKTKGANVIAFKPSTQL